MPRKEVTPKKALWLLTVTMILLLLVIPLLLNKGYLSDLNNMLFYILIFIVYLIKLEGLW